MSKKNPQPVMPVFIFFDIFFPKEKKSSYFFFKTNWISFFFIQYRQLFGNNNWNNNWCLDISFVVTIVFSHRMIPSNFPPSAQSHCHVSFSYFRVPFCYFDIFYILSTNFLFLVQHFRLVFQPGDLSLLLTLFTPSCRWITVSKTNVDEWGTL